MKTNQVRAAVRPIIKGLAALGLAAAGASSWAVQYSLTELPTLDGFANVA